MYAFTNRTPMTMAATTSIASMIPHTLFFSFSSDPSYPALLPHIHLHNIHHPMYKLPLLMPHPLHRLRPVQMRCRNNHPLQYRFCHDHLNNRRHRHRNHRHHQKHLSGISALNTLHIIIIMTTHLFPIFSPKYRMYLSKFNSYSNAFYYKYLINSTGYT